MTKNRLWRRSRGFFISHDGEPSLPIQPTSPKAGEIPFSSHGRRNGPTIGPRSDGPSFRPRPKGRSSKVITKRQGGFQMVFSVQF